MVTCLYKTYFISLSNHSSDVNLKLSIWQLTSLVHNYFCVSYSFEPVFMKYGVDVVIEAHEHSYERLWPVYQGNVYQENYNNPKAPVHIVSGAAGCNEAFGVCVNPMLGPRGWSP